ncbi:MAG: hypothetical protein IJ111_09930 [Eggerthellaceae bacterium]|nr:hypothetical protein [Eggerthellaceae bacterium]
MAYKLSKKQRIALKQIDELSKERKRENILAIASIVLMVVLILLYNYGTYYSNWIDPDNTIIRGALYAIAVVIAGFCGIMFMRANQKKAKMDSFRQATGISREVLEAWNRGDIE